MNAILSSTNVWLIAFGIFILRVLNMTIDTIRMLMVVRGMRTVTWILGVLQTALFIIVFGSVINDMNNLLNIAAYSVGFGTGNVIGMMLEKRLAIGYTNITIISSLRGQEIAEKLRTSGHAVTEIPARGKDGTVEILECSVQRKLAQEVQNIALEIDPKVFITSRDIQRVWRGYWRA
ncbi:MAG: DUF2179 domain-containing protein [Anaerolineaceae bacterium]|nr:DUF2179 domain-containing protein [Anaerolineaceae bacterium]